jgi:hypothetical protein
LAAFPGYASRATAAVHIWQREVAEMEVPLAEHFEGARSQCSDDNSDAVPPQQLPEALRAKLRGGIALGLAGPRWVPDWLWLCAGVVGMGAGGFLWYRAVNIAKNKMGVVATLMFVHFCLCGVLSAVGVHALRRGSEGYLDSVLDAPVSAPTARTLAKAVKTLRSGTWFGLLSNWAIYYGLAWVAKPEEPLHWLALVLAFGLYPVFQLQADGAQLAQGVMGKLTADRIEQLAAEVRQSTAATADFDRFTAGAFGAHEDTQRFSRLMLVPLVTTAAMLVSAVLAWMLLLLSPEPNSESGFLFHYVMFNNWLDMFGATGFACMTVWTLASPAKVTSACQRLASAVNDLRATQQPDGSVVLAKPEELLRIEGLKRYITELNNDQGMVRHTRSAPFSYNVEHIM